MSNLYRPPFSNAAGYAQAVASLVKDARSPRADPDFVGDALEQLANDVAPVVSSDIGDGTTQEWELGKAAEPFADWTLGFSEKRRIRVERLSASATQDPPEDLLGSEFRIDERSVSGVQKLFLRFESVPPASPSQYRVHWQRHWKVDATQNEVRLAYQMAVVYLACALKCEALAAAYQNTRADGGELFQGLTTADAYENRAKSFWAKYRKAISPATGGLTSGQVRTGKDYVFPRGYRV